MSGDSWMMTRSRSNYAMRQRLYNGRPFLVEWKRHERGKISRLSISQSMKHLWKLEKDWREEKHESCITMQTSRTTRKPNVNGRRYRRLVIFTVVNMDKRRCQCYLVVFECLMTKVSSRRWYDSRHDKRGDGVYERYKRQVPRKEKDEML